MFYGKYAHYGRQKSDLRLFLQQGRRHGEPRKETGAPGSVMLYEKH